MITTEEIRQKQALGTAAFWITATLTLVSILGAAGLIMGGQAVHHEETILWGWAWMLSSLLIGAALVRWFARYQRLMMEMQNAQVDSIRRLAQAGVHPDVLQKLLRDERNR